MYKSINKPQRELFETEALGRAAALCSTGEHCVSDIEDKLTRWGQSPEAQARIIARLLEERYIDEARFARAYAHDKLRYNQWGRIKIDIQLRQLGISDADRRNALDELPEDEYEEILVNLIKGKRPSIKGASSYERNGKLIRFLTGHGFEMSAIMPHLPDADESDYD